MAKKSFQFSTAIVVLLAFVLSSPMVFAGECENVFSNKLKDLGFGGFSKPAGGIRKEVLQRNSATYLAALEKLKAERHEAMKRFLANPHKSKGKAIHKKFKDSSEAKLNDAAKNSLDLAYGFDALDWKLLNSGQQFNQVYQFSKDQNVTAKAYFQDQQMIAFTIQSESKEELVQLAPNCKISEVNVTLKSGDTGESSLTLSSRFCHDLPLVESLMKKIKPSDLNKAETECEEQGGSLKALKEINKCLCPAGMEIAAAQDTCLPQRKPHVESEAEKLDNFATFRQASFDVQNPQAIQAARSVCSEYRRFLVPAEPVKMSSKLDGPGTNH